MINFKFLKIILISVWSWKEASPEEAWIPYKSYCRILGDNYNLYSKEWREMNSKLCFKFPKRGKICATLETSTGSHIYNCLYSGSSYGKEEKKA